MNTKRKEKRPSLMARVLRVAAMTAMVFGAGAATLPGCLNRPIEPVEPRTTATIVERLQQSGVDKIDLLLTIDNSRSMADKQEILKLAVPDLVRALVNPKCVDSEGDPSAQQPATPTEACPDGFKREFEPIVNIHIGIITSSLGSYGADTCDVNAVPSNDDKAYLVDRVSTDSLEKVPTWNEKRFLVWDPDTNNPTHVPQGETDESVLIDRIRAMVSGAGEVGCGFEAQLEAWYRFLVEPDPYETIELDSANKIVLTGRDQLLLQQRKDFLRPDSLLAIIMLTDENDCSIRPVGRNYAAALSGGTSMFHLPKPRAACATDPNSECCSSCASSVPASCDTSQDDCGDPNSPNTLSQLEDALNVRCFDQKRRFGYDFLWPTDRYVTGLTSTQVADRGGQIVQNPLFTDLNPEDENSNIRDPGLVFLAGIVGVPWQDIARKDANGNPSLINGLDKNGKAVGGFQSAAEMVENGTWKVILGDPKNYVPPTDPLMIESIDPRTGTNPVTGDMLQPPSAPEGANPINGHEWTIANRGDLQYACIFPLVTPTDCTGKSGCDCGNADNDNPLCDPANRTIQKYAKAYPGVRELAVIQGVGTQGIVGSICPEQQTNPAEPNFGYRPAVGAIIERLKLALGGQCLPRSLTPNASGQVSCLILEARKTDVCDCSGNGREEVGENNKAAVTAAQADPTNSTQGWNCFCAITQTTGPALTACQNEVNEPVIDAEGNAAHGWCYVDATTNTGNPALVASCPETEQRLIRFVGDGNAQTGATLLITCSGE